MEGEGKKEKGVGEGKKERGRERSERGVRLGRGLGLWERASAS